MRQVSLLCIVLLALFLIVSAEEILSTASSPLSTSVDIDKKIVDIPVNSNENIVSEKSNAKLDDTVNKLEVAPEAVHQDGNYEFKLRHEYQEKVASEWNYKPERKHGKHNLNSKQNQKKTSVKDLKQKTKNSHSHPKRHPNGHTNNRMHGPRKHEGKYRPEVLNGTHGGKANRHGKKHGKYIKHDKHGKKHEKHGKNQQKEQDSMNEKPTEHEKSENIKNESVTPSENTLVCTTCTVAMSAALVAVKSNKTLEVIEEVLKKACFGYQLCDELIEKFTKYLPYLAILAEAQDYNGRDMCSMLNYCEVDCCKTDNIPEQVHLGYNEFNRASVTWTTRQHACSEVQIEGNIIDNSGNLVSIYHETVKGFEKTYTSAGWRGWMHYVKDLGPSTLVQHDSNGNSIQHRYRVGCSSANAWGEWTSMRIAVLNRNIAIVGDMGFENSDSNLQRLQQHIEEFDQIIILGDQSYSDGNQRKWDEFLRKFEPIFSKRALLTITGNHEIGVVGLPFLNISGYDYRFQLPNIDMTNIPLDNGSRWYYSYNYGPIHFIGMDSEATLDLPLIIDQQIDFIIKDLEKVNRTVTPFVVAMSHRPYYCSGAVGACDPKQSGYMLGKVEHIFAKYRVDLVLSGHRHNMERCGPVLFGQETTQDKAPIYIVNGAGGNRENFQGFDKPIPSSKFRLTKEYGYAFLSWDENATELTWRQFTSSNDALVDSVVIKRKQF